MTESLWVKEQHRWPRAELLWQEVAVPLSKLILQSYREPTRSRPLCMGITGTQGSGKSTLADMLTCILTQNAGLGVANLSLDDFYYSKQERKVLAELVHPLFATRGVPGTHNICIALKCFTQLKQPQVASIQIPRFNKATDDIQLKSAWSTVQTPLDVILFEGWCLGLTPQSEEALIDPVNSLERQQDPKAIWRKAVNTHLAQSYQTLFQQVDEYCWLNAQSFDVVYRWRLQQEHALREKEKNQMTANQQQSPQPEVPEQRQMSGIMTDAQVKTFIQYYERLTKHSFQCLPKRAKYQVKLNPDRTIASSNLPGA